MPLPKTFKLASGYEIPSLGYGCYATTPASNAFALKHGLMLLDTAWIYNTEIEVGKGIKQSGVPRSKIFLTTKTTEWHHSPAMVKKGLYDSLKRLQVDYVDLLIIHWPIAYKPTKEGLNVDLYQIEDQLNCQLHKGTAMYEVDSHGKAVIDEELSNNHLATWRAMEELVDEGKVRSLGLSNFSIAQTEALLPHVKHPITLNQCEAHPWLQNNELVEYCKKKNILFQAYSALGTNIKVTDDAAIVRVAEKNKMSPQALVMSWAVQRGTCPLTKSTSEERIVGNTAVKELSPEDFAAIENCNQKGKKRQNWGHEAMHKSYDDVPQ